MDKIFLRYNAEKSTAEEEIVVVFNAPELAALFTERHQIKEKGSGKLS